MNIVDYFKNIVLRTSGADRDLLTLLKDKDITKAKTLFEDKTAQVNKAISEYDTDLHNILKRPNKYRKNRDEYETEKLPRSWQEHINEVELFFLLNNPIKWTSANQKDKAFELFTEFLKDTRFNSTTREAKRIAGAETHSAKLYHIFQDKGEPKVRVQVLSKQKGYDIYPLRNQYGQMLALGVGYYLKENGKTVEHFDVYTAETTFRCKKNKLGWEVTPIANPTGKINAVYYEQDKAWRKAQPRIERDEYLDSKSADVNNYFADPIAVASADVISSLIGPEAVGRLIKLQGRESEFRYIEPPTSIEMKATEKKDNKEAILTDTFTPPFDFESLNGLGTLSGEAIKRIMTLGYIKRNRNMEIYEELIDREKNIIIAIIEKVLNPSISFKETKISFEFQDPFKAQTDKDDIISCYSNGLMSLETAISKLGLVDDVQGEIKRISEAKREPLFKE